MVACVSDVSSMRKKSKTKNSEKLLKEKIWELCKKIIRKRDGDICIICKRDGLVGSNWHTGHFIPSSICGAFLRYDLRNIHSSCYNCNINLGGNGATFYKELVSIYGQKFVDSIFVDKQKITKADIIFYQNKYEELKKMAKWSKSKLFNYTKNLGQGGE
jgi:hypothetical protein